MFRTVTVHPQELLCRYCMCRLWYVVIRVLRDTFSRTYRVVRFLPQSAYTVSTKKLLRMDRWGPKHIELQPKCWLKLTQWNHTVYLVGLYILQKWYTELTMSICENILEFDNMITVISKCVWQKTQRHTWRNSLGSVMERNKAEKSDYHDARPRMHVVTYMTI